MMEWSYTNVTYTGCQRSADHASKWCYVLDQQQCQGSVKTDKVGRYWDTCGVENLSLEESAVLVSFSHHGCKCKETWHYHGMQKEGCSLSADARSPWCFVADGEACIAEGGEKSTSVLGEVWDFCHMGDSTDHHCHCSDKWIYGGLSLTGCNRTDDHEEPWCYLTDGGLCPGAIKTHKKGFYWDTCVSAWNSMPFRDKPSSIFGKLGNGSAVAQSLQGWGGIAMVS